MPIGIWKEPGLSIAPLAQQQVQELVSLGDRALDQARLVYPDCFLDCTKARYRYPLCTAPCRHGGQWTAFPTVQDHFHDFNYRIELETTPNPRSSSDLAARPGC